MASEAFTTDEFTCRVERPDDWHIRVDPLPQLDRLRQVFTLSNRPIAVPEPGASTARSVVDRLDPDAVLVWVHYRLAGDPDLDIEDPTSDYAGAQYAVPGEVGTTVPGSPVLPSTQLTWRRPEGPPEVTVTALAWEGPSVDDGDARCLQDVIGSLAVDFRP